MDPLEPDPEPPRDRRKTDSEELKELLLTAFLDVQQEQEQRGAQPRRDENVLARFRGVFEFIGAIQLGLLLAAVGVLLVFLVSRMMFHLDLARYFPF